jgi:hypothetical protein
LPDSQDDEAFPYWVVGRGPKSVEEVDAITRAEVELRRATVSFQNAAGEAWALRVLDEEARRIRAESGNPPHRRGGTGKAAELEFVAEILALRRAWPDRSAASLAAAIWPRGGREHAASPEALTRAVQRILRRASAENGEAELWQEALQARVLQALRSGPDAEAAEAFRRLWEGEALSEGDARIIREVRPLIADAMRPPRQEG